ncbi:hypothetical protein GCK32_005093 [Trichostrongylus colubriformis]|uniref:TTI1 C-terminal TPR domain-containing protein n=1 Tax=Trichostrongylus colubriformis TaxID=6319 RepID=A0AAN8ESZ4_TRICO
MVYTEMMSSEKSVRASLAILTTLILDGMESSFESYTLFTLIETCIEWLKEMIPSVHNRDDVIEHDISAPKKETVLTVSLVSLLAVAFTRIAQENKQLKAMGLSVSEFLYKHGSYIVHHVAIAARSRSEHDHAPVVLCAVLDKVDDLRLYSSVKHIIEDLLQALDRFKQDFCILVMRSMLSFVSAVSRWFPELKPSEVDESCSVNEDEDEEVMEVKRKELPPPIADVEHVLLRTKHLLSSPHLPIRMLAMRILREGLYVLRYFNDALLPMVHQNWEALINRFSDKELEIREEALKVVVQMVSVSKTFVYRRVRYQLWPILEKWVISNRLHTFASGTLAYKLQLLVIRSIADIWIGIEALPADVDLVLEVLTVISQQSTDVQLKTESHLASEQLKTYLKERTRSSEEVSC